MNLHRRRKLGMPPGSLIDFKEKSSQRVDVTVLDYNSDQVQEYSVRDELSLRDCLNESTVSWINVDGIHNVDLIQRIGDKFQLHPLMLEDIMNPNHRPKIEDFETFIHFTLKMITYDKVSRKIKSEQVSFVLGSNWVISFQEQNDDIFDPIRERIRNNKGTIRKRGADYLLYALVDIIVDHYFIVIDEIEHEISHLEKVILQDEHHNVMHEIQRLKKDFIFLRKSILPVRDAVGSMQKVKCELINEQTQIYLKDVFDHTVYITDSIEVDREMLNSLMEVHLSSLSNRLNKVMKVLTVISTIFIPLTFIVGVYGMNFKFMPEIEWEYGYLYSWILLILVTLVLLIVLKKKKWM